MSVTKRDQQPLPKRCKPTVKLTPKIEIYLPTAHFLCGEFQHARRHELGITRDDHEEFLHQYRVSLRRDRALIGLLSPLFQKTQTERVKLELKALMQHTNPLRDLDVFLMAMDDYFSQVDHAHHKGLTRFFDDVQDERRRALKELKRWLKSDDYQQRCQLISNHLNEYVAQPTEEGKQPAARLAHNLLWRHFKQVEVQCRDISEASPDRTIHQLRISCKKFRYLLEYFLPLLSRQQSKLQINQLKLLQDQLGSFNDVSVQRHFVKQHRTSQKGSNAREQAIKSLLSVIKKQYQQAKQEALTQINAFQQPDNLDLYYSLYPADDSDKKGSVSKLSHPR